MSFPVYYTKVDLCNNICMIFEKNVLTHIQYPVGQGGLHLGIIDSIAYIYDCGGNSKANWDSIFDDIKKHLYNCNELHIFISHLHTDHCNKLFELIKQISSISSLKIKLYIPALSEIEKIMFFCEALLQKDLSENFINYYMRFLLSDAKIEFFPNVAIVPVNTPEKRQIKDILLYFFTTNIIFKQKVQFENALKKLGISTQEIIEKIQRGNKDIIEQIKNVFKTTFGTKHITNKIMLILYCGYLRFPCCHFSNSWLHTGDVQLKKNTDFYNFMNHLAELLINVDFVQIPHHGSKYNINYAFPFVFKPCAIFYYTSNSFDKRGNRNINGIMKFPHQKILKVSEDPMSKIVI